MAQVRYMKAVMLHGGPAHGSVRLVEFECGAEVGAGVEAPVWQYMCVVEDEPLRRTPARAADADCGPGDGEPEPGRAEGSRPRQVHLYEAGAIPDDDGRPQVAYTYVRSVAPPPADSPG
jgi:hypothetical protein